MASQTGPELVYTMDLSPFGKNNMSNDYSNLQREDRDATG